jgi:hypothetical protein
MHHHELKIEATAAAVTEWQTNVRTITDKIAKAQAVLAESKKTRNEQVFAAAMGDHEVRKHLDHALEQERAAEIDLEILRSSLRHAEAELRTAENAQKIAADEFRRARVHDLARQRCVAAAAIDQAFADFNKAWATFSDLGSELLGLASQDPGANALYLAETISGEARLVASLPKNPFLAVKERFPFMPVSTQKSLADSERSYWRLPPAEEEKAA